MSKEIFDAEKLQYLLEKYSCKDLDELEKYIDELKTLQEIDAEIKREMCDEGND